MICEICKKREVAEEGRKVCSVCLGLDKESVQDVELYQIIGMTCERCGTEWAERDFGRDGKLKYFHLNKSLRICCWRAKCNEARERKKNGSTPQVSVHKPPVKDDLPEDDHVLILDFTKHQQLLNSIIQKAELELRTPENQILWWMISTLQEREA